jgi:hypothetical protein
MDIKRALLDEHSKKQTMRIVNFIGSDKKRFKKLFDIFLNGEYRVKQRAAWPLGYVSIEYPELIFPHLSKLIEKLRQKDLHPSIPRNILRIFQEIDIPEKHHGRLVDVCIGFITDARAPAAIRAFSMSVAAQICKNYPELSKELQMIFSEMARYPQQPAIASRLKSAGKLLK